MCGELIQVVTTVDSLSVANELAAELLESRMAACIQISSPVISCYRWNKELRQDQEFVLTIKTTRAAWPRLLAFLIAEHSYDEPQIIALPMIECSETYGSWVAEQVDSGNDQAPQA